MTEPAGSPKNHDFSPPLRRSSTESSNEDKARHELTQEMTPAAQLKEYERLKSVEDRLGGLQLGKTYCLLSRKWFVQWMQWVGHPSARAHGRRRTSSSDAIQRALSASSSPQLSSEPPELRRLSSVPEVVLEPLARERSWTKDQPGPITNEFLLEEDSSDRIKVGLFENFDFEIISLEMWELLQQLYGGGPKIEKRAVRMLNGNVQIELHLHQLRACKLSDRDTIVSCEVSRTDTLGLLRRRLCHELSLDFDRVQICDLDWEECDNNTLEECREFMKKVLKNQVIVLDDQQSDIPDTGECTATPLSTTSESDSKENSLSKHARGLDNLGNTCFMNSSLQCLANIPPLRDFFVNDGYKNSVRMFGQVTEKTGGRLAEAYGKLLKSQWACGSDSVEPWDFKELVGNLEERFTGNRQHDSMEFLEFLIDGLKEDCNRVKGKKLYVERADANGRDDAVVALEAGAKFLFRNDSDIDDLFVGFFRSSLTCPEEKCGDQSIAFDAYSSLKLPVMSAAKARNRSFEVVVMPLATSGRAMEKHRVTVAKFGSIEILVNAAASAAGLDPVNCILSEIYPYGTIYKFFEEDDRVEDIGSCDHLMLYEVQDGPSFKKPPEERWGLGSRVKAQELVRVKSFFESDSKDSHYLSPGLYGVVEVVDSDGDAKIRFDGIPVCQWVFKKNGNLKKLRVDKSIDPALVKNCIEDGSVYTFYELWKSFVMNPEFAQPQWEENDGLPEVDGKDLDMQTSGICSLEQIKAACAANSECVGFAYNIVDGTWRPRMKDTGFDPDYGFDKSEADIWQFHYIVNRVEAEADKMNFILDIALPYWNSKYMQDFPPVGESDSPDACGVIVMIRRAVDEGEQPAKGESPAKPEYLCQPLVFHVEREASVAKLRERIQLELLQRQISVGDKLAWYKQQKNDEEMQLEDDNEEAAESIRLGVQQYIILELPAHSSFNEVPKLDDLAGEEEPEETVTLDTCFRWMTEVEQLSEDDSVMCQCCKELKQKFKKIDIWSVPPVLVLQLKRFEFTGVERQRVNTMVQFPLEGLDLTEYCLSSRPSFPEQACLRAGKRVKIVNMTSSLGQKLNGSEGIIKCIDSTIGKALWCVQLDDGSDFSTLIASENLQAAEAQDQIPSIPPIFDLAALSKHIGGAKAGHYVAYARSSQTGSWHFFDDEDVSLTTPEKVAAEQAGAYVLFYIRRDCRPQGWGEPD